MTTLEVLFLIISLTTLAAVLLGGYFTLQRLSKNTADIKSLKVQNTEGAAMKLQALERLTLYAERSGLKNLVERLNDGGKSAAEMHHLLTETLRSEYEYNMTQQIYVSAEVWHAITRLKDQNIYIVHHITSNLTPGASGADLCRMILEYSLTPNAEMNVIVLDALQFEAKKILN
jgi:hypothetical protein